MDAINILTMKMNMVQMQDVLNYINQWVNDKQNGNYIAVCNAYDAVMCMKDKNVRKAVNNSSITVADGISMVKMANIYGYPLRKRVYGPELMNEVLKDGIDKGYKHFFYGTTNETLKKLNENLHSKYSGINIVETFSPPFRPLTEQEDNEIVDLINQSGADIVWVGLGTPKQQLWMCEHKDKLNVPVMLGVGAAFDFAAGTAKQAPKWVGDAGFEWFYRLCTQPCRLWKRYIVYNFIFLIYALKQIVVDLFMNRVKRHKVM